MEILRYYIIFFFSPSVRTYYAEKEQPYRVSDILFQNTVLIASEGYRTLAPTPYEC